MQVDGQLKTGRDVVVAALLGAEEFGFATAPLVVMGCVMMRVCHLNTCPVGIATQDPELRKTFTGKPEFVQTFFRFIADEVRELMAELGFRTLDDMIGRAECLDYEPAKRALEGERARPVTDSSRAPDGRRRAEAMRAETRRRTRRRARSHADCARRGSVAAADARRDCVAHPKHRSHGRHPARLRGDEALRRAGLPDDTIRINFTGAAGQSFGAFLPRGITLSLEGEANDFVGKGLSGGRLVVRPPRHATFVAEENVIVGNVALYGATSGEAFVRGVAGERFAVRNSGAHAVVEGVGDHACEYMTGGVVVVLGGTGRNFAAGMSGGTAYVLDADGSFALNCNIDMVDIERLDDEEERLKVHRLDRPPCASYRQCRSASGVLEAWRIDAAPDRGRGPA